MAQPDNIQLKNDVGDVRGIFLDYFRKKDHLILPSASLIPEGDSTVLLTTAGMQPFKPYYLGTKKPPHKKIATVQKCFRTSDIDSVGYTDRHLTFFEMLGNFSFGDYFKKEAIEFALDFVLNILHIPLERLWVSVFKGEQSIPPDEESFEIWVKNGIKPERIYKFGKKENFWGPAGETGPCGPCSEIIYDFGEENGCGRKDCNPGCDCGRFLEIWNLVFTQYNFDGTKYSELPAKNIDTGMGLERIAAVLEETPSVFKTPLFREIVQKIEEISGKKLTSRGDPDFDPEINRCIKIVADHSRAIYFLISDGVLPSNEGRGYILRRIIRRAVRFGMLLGIKGRFLNEIGKIVIDKYSSVYPELIEKKNTSLRLVDDEEMRFSKTLKEGTRVLIQNIARLKSSGQKDLPPEDAFRLYDTFGFPVELTTEILKENGLSLDISGFQKFLREHSHKSREKTLFDKKLDTNIELYKKISKMAEVEFVGYEKCESSSHIVGILKRKTNGNSKEVTETVSAGEEAEIILDLTPFYGEKGGQIGDRGFIKSSTGIFRVEDCKIPVEGLITHNGRCKEGYLKTGDDVEAKVDVAFRNSVSKNHTSTHLLHWALRSIFGKEITQAGSFVGERGFRFDYAIYSPPSSEELAMLERIINEKIQSNDIVRCFETTKEYADEIGAISLFDEKYGKFVRVVEIGNYSRELCGGTHVKRTGEIGLFKITSESSIGANLRRIEAVTGIHAYEYLSGKEKILRDLSRTLETEEDRLLESIAEMRDELREAKEELDLLRRRVARDRIMQKVKSAEYISEDKGPRVIEFDFSKLDYKLDIDPKNMGVIGDEIKNILGNHNTFIVFGNLIDGKPILLLQATSDLVNRGLDCGKIAREAGAKLNGGGGGKPEYAQAGGSNAQNLEIAMKFVKERVMEIIKDK